MQKFCDSWNSPVDNLERRMLVQEESYREWTPYMARYCKYPCIWHWKVFRHLCCLAEGLFGGWGRERGISEMSSCECANTLKMV